MRLGPTARLETTTDDWYDIAAREFLTVGCKHVE